MSLFDSLSNKTFLLGGSIKNVCDEMAKVIHTSFSASVFTGVGTNVTAVSTGPVAGKLV